MGVSDENCLKLYLRLPVKIIDAQQVKNLHPLITKVVLPRQKSRRWCTVEVGSVSAIKELKGVRIDGKKVYVKSLKKRKSEQNPGWDILSGDDLMDEDYHNDLVIDNFFDDGDDFELNSEVVLFLPAEELEADEDDYFVVSDDTVDIDDDDDEDYVLSDSLDDEDFDDDNAIVMPSDESSPERNN
ncbi:hypothetical protein TcasGA2_TC015166 [Tribolium castaneum]|uniref:Uncharacterized protein n=1 Tax=Tribolium castaneum TaxID=7070 RepID=A0A139WGQ4_TRICA|nr:hypothetical protein TcasGA2_TC015166 [Tribolium castaneum]